MQKLFFMIIAVMFSQTAFAEEKKNDFHIMPFTNYAYLGFAGQKIHTPGAGIIFTNGDLSPLVSDERNSLFIAAVYKQYYVDENRAGYEDLYHDISMLADKKYKRHLIFGVLTSQAAEPFFGGLHTFTGGIGYGYEFIQNETISLTAGGGLVVTDFGIELSNGAAWPVIPLPILRFYAETSWVNFSLQFQKSLTVSFTLLPETKIRLTNTFVMEPFDMRNVRDIYFDTAIWYRFFSKDSKMGDLIGIGLGIKNSGFRFDLSEKKKSYKVNYYSAYGIFDMSFLRLSAGYSFEGREIYDGKDTNNIGGGFFITAFFTWRF